MSSSTSRKKKSTSYKPKPYIVRCQDPTTRLQSNRNPIIKQP